MRRGIVLLVLLGACGGGGGGGPDAGATVTTDRCDYVALPPTAGAGGTVTAGALQAGTAEAPMNLPVSSALAAYTARAGFLGAAATVDNRRSALSGSFYPSVGIETAPRIRALALSAGGETVIIMELELGYIFEGMVWDLEKRLGDSFDGKVLISASHSHSSWGHFSAHSAYQMGSGVFRETVYDALLDALESTARAALAARRPAKIGFYSEQGWDPTDVITRDRRGENDELMGGPRKDDAFFLIRIDGTDDTPIAMVPVYGVHGTINSEDNSLASSDSIGAMERVVEESFDSPVLVMHLQGAAGDVSPVPYGAVDCSNPPDDPDDPCFEWLRDEGHGRAAAPVMLAAWQAAGANMQTDLAIEMLTRSIELGPKPETFTIRDGALSYAPFVRDRVADGVIYDGNGDIASPIDEFNAPVGAGLCEKDEIMFSNGLIPGDEGLWPYASCARVGAISDIFGALLATKFESDETHPICQSTRATISALRLGDYLVATLPGEPTVMLADLLRSKSPVAADKTILVGYAQGHDGYLLTPEDWLAGGYEASINLWGPLEGEYMVEQLAKLMPLAMTPEREDGTAGGTDRWQQPTVDDNLPIDDPSPMAGTIPDPVPDGVWVRSGHPASAQPPATVKRVSGIATFVWIGDDPLVTTPVVTLEREVTANSWETVTRKSGRVVHDHAILLEYTPDPVRRVSGEPQTHYWAVELQAVPWLGAETAAGDSLDGMDARAAFPLGRYRFHVTGKAYELTSDPFEVTAADLGVSATRAGSVFTAAVTLDAPKGYRLLDMSMPSNQPVPVRGGTFHVSLALSAGGPVTMDVAIANDGTLTIDAGSDADAVTSITVTDPWGNAKTIAAP